LLRDRKSSDSIRIWIPGCATGEEAYSTAICITEFLESKKLTVPIHIFSTDLDEKAIDRARRGIYTKNALRQLSQKRLAEFFTSIDGHYQVAKSIRDMCTFSVHNLLKDPPFSRIDLVSCQNVLIYIEASPQRKILQSFHYALKPTGFLLLGKSESIGNATDLFQPLEKDSRLYLKKLQPLPHRFSFAARPNTSSPVLNRQLVEPRTETDVEREFDKILLSRYVPASVLINKDLEILRFRGSTTPYFEPASGKASLNLLKMLKEELIFEIRGLFQKVRKSNITASKDGIVLDGFHQIISIEILPIKSAKDIYYLIVFKPQGIDGVKSKARSAKISKRDQRDKIAKLEQALKDAREQVRTITEDFDVSREELQSANEEILSSNEELQSINEELETSKEELQSANEELTTINEELETRIEELKQSRDFSHAIIETIHGPMMVINGQMRVRTANKAFYEFFKLKPEETEGNFIYDLANSQWDIPALSIHLREIFPKNINFKGFEITHNFPLIGSRTMIVNAHRLVHGSGVNETQILLVFQDITRFREAEHNLTEAQEQLKLALEAGSVGTWLWNIKTNEVKGSREQAVLFGLDEEFFFTTYPEWENSLYPKDLHMVKQAIEKSIKEKTSLDIEFRIIKPDGNIRWILSKAKTYYDKKNEAERMMGVNIDITERKHAIAALEESEKRFHTLSDHAPVMIWMADTRQHCNFLNQTWLSFTGRKMEEEMGTGWYQEIHPEDRERFFEIYNAAYVNREAFKVDYRLKRFDGEYRWIMAHGVPRYTNENFIGFIGTCIDITERIDLERQKDDFMGIASHELKTPITSIKAYTQILQEKFRNINDPSSTSMLGRLDKQIDKLTTLINSLLDVARIQSGQMDYDEEFFDANDLITEVAEELQSTSPKHEIIRKFKNSGQVFADKARTAQVVRNLISNAIKYSPDSNNIIIETAQDDERYIVTVHDTGIGIPKDMQDRIFGRFFRVRESAGNRVSGLGLGLYISAQIIKQQGGEIWLQSEVGKGSSFSFSLPHKKQK
jgi:two-component system CheB/CheR fusion protein